MSAHKPKANMTPEVLGMSNQKQSCMLIVLRDRVGRYTRATDYCYRLYKSSYRYITRPAAYCTMLLHTYLHSYVGGSIWVLSSVGPGTCDFSQLQNIPEAALTQRYQDDGECTTSMKFSFGGCFGMKT